MSLEKRIAFSVEVKLRRLRRKMCEDKHVIRDKNLPTVLANSSNHLFFTLFFTAFFGVSAPFMKRFDHPPRKSPRAMRCHVCLHFALLLLDSYRVQAHFSSPHSSRRLVKCSLTSNSLFDLIKRMYVYSSLPFITSFLLIQYLPIWLFGYLPYFIFSRIFERKSDCAMLLVICLVLLQSQTSWVSGSACASAESLEGRK